MSNALDSLASDTASAFREAFGSPPDRLAAAPGRVNLIGEHTDYNDGFVLPMAIDRHIAIAFSPRSDGRVSVRAPQVDGEVSFHVEEAVKGSHSGWAAYVAGTLWSLREAGLPIQGFDALLLGNIPVGAGLSSSAAVETAVARAACEIAGVEWEPPRMALLAQRAERDYVGVSCGIMDQFASATSAGGTALLLDCRSLEYEHVPLPREMVVVIMDTGIRRTLATSEYNDRAGRCREALATIRGRYPEVAALRDVSPEMLAEFSTVLPPVTYRRARHVVTEMARPRLLADALRSNHLLRGGRLMNDSHRSLRELYEVSSPQLDLIVAIAEDQPECYGARLTGAGFGGCAVALVGREHVYRFVAVVGEEYRERTGLPGEVYPCEAAEGAHLLN